MPDYPLFTCDEVESILRQTRPDLSRARLGTIVDKLEYIVGPWGHPQERIQYGLAHIGVVLTDEELERLGGRDCERLLHLDDVVDAYTAHRFHAPRERELLRDKLRGDLEGVGYCYPMYNAWAPEFRAALNDAIRRGASVYRGGRYSVREIRAALLPAGYAFTPTVALANLEAARRRGETPAPDGVVRVKNL